MFFLSELLTIKGTYFPLDLEPLNGAHYHLNWGEKDRGRVVVAATQSRNGKVTRLPFLIFRKKGDGGEFCHSSIVISLCKDLRRIFYESIHHVALEKLFYRIEFQILITDFQIV